MRTILTASETPIGDFRRVPARDCSHACEFYGWSKNYRPEHVLARLIS